MLWPKSSWQKYLTTILGTFFFTAIWQKKILRDSDQSMFEFGFLVLIKKPQEPLAKCQTSIDWRHCPRQSNERNLLGCRLHAPNPFTKI